MAGGTTVREIRADPEAMAQLVQNWNANRPAALTGVIWYRLPISGERLNWRWPTLATVMAGNIPQPDVRAEARHPDPALVEVDLLNAGTADYSLPVQVTLSWTNAQLTAMDGLAGFDAVEMTPSAVRFEDKRPLWRLAARRTAHHRLGALQSETEVRVGLANAANN